MVSVALDAPPPDLVNFQIFPHHPRPNGTRVVRGGTRWVVLDPVVGPKRPTNRLNLLHLSRIKSKSLARESNPSPSSSARILQPPALSPGFFSPVLKDIPKIHQQRMRDQRHRFGFVLVHQTIMGGQFLKQGHGRSLGFFNCGSGRSIFISG